MGWTPEDAIGKRVHVPQNASKDAIGRARTIVGVVEDRTIYPAKFGSAATVYSPDPERVSTVLVRIAKNDVERGLRAIDTVWEELAPNVALKRQFMIERFEATYRQVNAMSEGGVFLAGFSILIATMGLLGIATHSVAQRTYEIGVRKTLGASMQQILTMLLYDFSKPILIGNLIAWPFAFGFVTLFDSLYVQKSAPSVTPYLGTLVLCLVVAWSAVFRKAWQAAHWPPAAVLRYE